MNVLTIPLREITEENIFFLDSKNNIIMDGMFTKITYLHECFSMSGIYIHIPISIKNIEVNPILQQKYTIYFSIETHVELIENIESLERCILNKYKDLQNNKIPVYSIHQSLQQGSFKIFKESKILQNNIDFSLKISGVWENNKNYGLSYKIIDAVNLI